MVQIECSGNDIHIAESNITAKDAADVLDKCRIELRKGTQIPSNAKLLKYRNEFVAFCSKREDGDDEYHELCAVVNEIKQLEERKILLQSKREDLKSLLSKRDYVSNESELEHIIVRLSANEKRFCTKLLRHPLVAANIEKLDSTCQDFASVLASTVQEMRAHGTWQVLADNANKNNALTSFRQRGEEMASKAKEARTLVSEFQETFRMEREEHDGRVCGLESESSRITKELAAIRNGTDMESMNHRCAMNGKVSAARSDAEQKEFALRADIDKLQRLIHKAARDNQARVSQIKSNIEMLETKKAAQHELAAKEDAAEAQMQSLRAKREENLKILVELQRRWDRDEAEKKRLNDEREEERREELRLREEEEYRRLCAKKITMAYRIYLRKKAKLAASQKSKKGKKGAKGKKKKKAS